MPESKFTVARLKEHLRKFFWVYLLGVALCMAGTNLLWTTTAPRVPYDQSVIVYLADGYSNPDALERVAAETLARTQADDPSLKLVEFQSLQYMGAEDYTSQMVLLTRLAVSEADAMLANAEALEAVIRSGATLPLDELLADGWMAGRGLEPYYATLTDEETGESETFLAALKLDGVNALADLGAFNNQGAYLCVMVNSTNQETTLEALEHMMDILAEAENAGTAVTE